MTTLAEVKQALDDKLSIVDTLRQEHNELKTDYVSKDSYAKLESLVTDVSKKFSDLEAEYQKELKEAKDLAEEASLKAGRKSTATGDEPDEASIEHKTAFMAYLRDRTNPTALADLKSAEEKALGSATGSGGGVAIPTVIDMEIMRKTSDESVMSSLVRTVELGTSDYKQLVNKGGQGYGWVGAGDVRAKTDNFEVYESEPTMGTIYAYPEFQEEQLDDVFFNLETELTDNVLEAFANGTDVGIIGGDGVKKMTGMLATAPVADDDGSRADMVYQFLASGVANTIGDGDQLVNLIYKLRKKYRKNASWMMNDLTTAKVRVLKDGDGRFLWADGLAVGQPDRLLGYSVNSVDAMPDIAANSTPIGFGDWKKSYTLVNRHGTRITKDEITKPGWVKWHIRQRKGGNVTDDDAAKFLKIAA
ncbi:MAG: phage major capsid protein [Aliishimia sp.]